MIPDFNVHLIYRDGMLYWKHKRQGRQLNKPVGSKHSAGYLQVWVDGVNYKVHRVVYAMHHGVMPDLVAHSNGDRMDNHIENLHQATRAENMRNTRRMTMKRSLETDDVKAIRTANPLWEEERNPDSRKNVLFKLTRREQAHLKDAGPYYAFSRAIIEMLRVFSKAPKEQQIRVAERMKTVGKLKSVYDTTYTVWVPVTVFSVLREVSAETGIQPQELARRLVKVYAQRLIEKRLETQKKNLKVEHKRPNGWVRGERHV